MLPFVQCTGPILPPPLGSCWKVCIACFITCWQLSLSASASAGISSNPSCSLPILQNHNGFRDLCLRRLLPLKNSSFSEGRMSSVERFSSFLQFSFLSSTDLSVCWNFSLGLPIAKRAPKSLQATVTNSTLKLTIFARLFKHHRHLKYGYYLACSFQRSWLKLSQSISLPKKECTSSNHVDNATGSCV